jgi:hypothetical protein
MFVEHFKDNVSGVLNATSGPGKFRGFKDHIKFLLDVLIATFPGFLTVTMMICFLNV